MTTARQILLACLIVVVAIGGVVLVRAATTVHVSVTDVSTRHIVNFQLGVGTCRPDNSNGNSCAGNFVRLLPQIETPDDVAEDVVAEDLGIKLPGQVTILAKCGWDTHGATVILYPSGTKYTYRVRTSPPFFKKAVTSRVMTSFVPDGKVRCMPAAG